ncbi:MAG: hypothetical protein EBV19_08205 [Flavobacteriia bacterium]|jgi:hypothetical protein|nr:hypothetical protein [Flavobacteriia bacterium]
MAEEFKQSRFKRLTNRYRLVVMNDHSYEEVVTFKITRLGVYIVSCFIFVLLVGLTTALISFTPLKFYIPGYGSQSERRELTRLKMRTDSLERQIRYREAYLDNLQKVLSGQSELLLDTAVISIPDLEQSFE